MIDAQGGAAGFGEKPQLAWLQVDKLGVDPSYQRSLATSRAQKLIQRIAAQFRWSAFQAVLAAAEGDGWKLIDGQHRVAAARLRGIALVPAVIIEAASLAEQAQSFIHANQDRRAVDGFALHRAKLTAGDARAAAIDQMARAAGITIPTTQPSRAALRPGQVLSIAVFGEIIEKFPAAALPACRAVAAAYGKEIGGLRAPFFYAAAMLIAGGITEAAITAALKRSTAAAFDAEINHGRASAGGKRAIVAEALLRARLAATEDLRISAAAQGPVGAPPRAAGADGRAAGVDMPPGTRTPEKAPVGGETAKPRPSRQDGQIPGAGGSLIPRTTIPFQPPAAFKAEPAPFRAEPAAASKYPSFAGSTRRPDAIEDLLAWRRYCGDEVKKLGPDRWRVNGGQEIDTAELVRRTNNLRRSTDGRPFEIALPDAPAAAPAAEVAA